MLEFVPDPDAEVIRQVAVLEREIFSDPWSETALRETEANPQAMILCAKDDDTVVGYVIFYYVLDEGEIARIAVNPEFRRRGIASAILDYLHAWSAKKNIARWLLDVRISNAPAIAFYRGCGFTEDGVRKNFYANPKEDAILMSCDLSQK